MSKTDATNRRPKLTAEPAYENAHLVATDLVWRITDLLHDLPAPGDDTYPVSWSDLATVIEVNRQLSEVAAFLESATRRRPTC